jgi:hypothetical protein
LESNGAGRCTLTDNPHIESLNGNFRDERLNMNWFMSQDAATDKTERWRRDSVEFLRQRFFTRMFRMLLQTCTRFGSGVLFLLFSPSNNPLRNHRIRDFGKSCDVRARDEIVA